MKYEGGIYIKKILYYTQLCFIFSLFWISLFENISLYLIISALIVSLTTIYISEKIFIQDSYYNTFYFSFWKILKYFFVLIFEIYKSAFALIPKILEGKAEPCFISIKTDLKKSEHIAILSNSITLTPGTITVDVSEDNILVLWFDPKNVDDKAAGDIIKGSFENVLREDV